MAPKNKDNAETPNTSEASATPAPTKAKRKAVAKKVYILNDGTDSRAFQEGKTERLEFRFTNGEVRTVNLDNFSPVIQQAAMYHGFAQKLGDSYNTADGNAADAVNSFDETYAQLTEGDWTTASEGGGPRIGELVDAMVRLQMRRTGKTDEEVRPAIKERVGGWDGDQRKNATTNPQVAAELAQVRAEKAAERAKLAAQKAGEVQTEDDGLGDLLD